MALSYNQLTTEEQINILESMERELETRHFRAMMRKEGYDVAGLTQADPETNPDVNKYVVTVNQEIVMIEAEIDQVRRRKNQLIGS